MLRRTKTKVQLKHEVVTGKPPSCSSCATKKTERERARESKTQHRQATKNLCSMAVCLVFRYSQKPFRIRRHASGKTLLLLCNGCISNSLYFWCSVRLMSTLLLFGWWISGMSNAVGFSSFCTGWSTGTGKRRSNIYWRIIHKQHMNQIWAKNVKHVNLVLWAKNTRFHNVETFLVSDFTRRQWHFWNIFGKPGLRYSMLYLRHLWLMTCHFHRMI